MISSNTRIASFVDKEWYLATYPDVAEAGMDPVLHFERHGRFEGRLPCLLNALPLERDLWANAFEPESYLKSLSEQAIEESINGLYACKALAAFYLFQGNYSKAWSFAEKLIANLECAAQFTTENTIFLLAFESSYRCKRYTLASELLKHKRWPNSNDKQLAAQMLDASNAKLAHLNKIYKKNRLYRVHSTDSEVSLDTLKGNPSFRLSDYFFEKIYSSHKVSVIVPLYNGEGSIRSTIESLLNQTWQAIEIIIVDDCSTDNSLEVVESYRSEPKVKIVSNERNMGAYPTRNKGARIASGNYITVMDADDWAHPQKIEKQVLPFLKKQNCIGTVSHWVRCSDTLEFTRLRIEESWIYRNISSLMIRSSVFDSIGYWDELKASADTEFYLRLMASYGEESVVEVYPNVPLSFGRVHENSLTQRSETHLVTQFGGVRQEHLAFARMWHFNGVKPLKLDYQQEAFPVPLQLCPNPALRNSSIESLYRWQNVFNNRWYLRNYPNVDKSGLSVYEHFIPSGELNDYSPTPEFIPSAYRYLKQLQRHESPTWRALIDNWDFTQIISLEGSVSNLGQHIAVFAHSLSPQVFGAELSLLDVVKACTENGYKVSVFLPNASNFDYVDKVLKHAARVNFVPFRWFSRGRDSLPEITKLLEDYYTDYDVSLVYINTIMLMEPYIAANNSNIPTITHVRELPEYDEGIRNILNETAEETLERLEQYSQYFVVNSQYTANWLKPDMQHFVLYNKVEAPKQLVQLDIDKPLRVCMLSSNIRKKGVDDFFSIAELCSKTDIEFTLYGPVTQDVKNAESKFSGGRVRKCGYVDDPYQAIMDNDVVLSLSWFKESFGRTAAEAMICGRVVVGYNWGAIPEIVTEASGLFVPFRRVDLIAEILENLADDQNRLKGFAKSARERATLMFSEKAYNAQLGNVLEQILDK